MPQRCKTCNVGGGAAITRAMALYRALLFAIVVHGCRCGESEPAPWIGAGLIPGALWEDVWWFLPAGACCLS